MKPHEMDRNPKTRSDEMQAQVPLLPGSAARPRAQCDRVGVARAGSENWLPAAKPQVFGGPLRVHPWEGGLSGYLAHADPGRHDPTSPSSSFPFPGAGGCGDRSK